MTERAGLRGDCDVDDAVDVDVNTCVGGAGGFVRGTVIVILTARLTLQCLQVAVLTDLLQPVLAQVTEEVGPLAGLLLAALSVDTVSVLTGPVRTVLVPATVWVLPGGEGYTNRV